MSARATFPTPRATVPAPYLKRSERPGGVPVEKGRAAAARGGAAWAGGAAAGPTLAPTHSAPLSTRDQPVTTDK